MSRTMTRPNESGNVSRLYDDPFQSLESRMNQLFRGVMDSVGNGDAGLGVYPVDVDEDDNAITIEAELPGFKRDEIDVLVENGVLTIKAERQPKENDSSRKRHMSERRYTRVQRAFTLPRTVDGSDVEASLDGGVLTLTLKKTEESKPRKIEIRTNE
ncbi:18 kDa heat shock protein [Rosistilla carotiformis]|uniref:18 kDa heat shock protein n=1 Tax=Rosistilla carotiformis TaxID=2528017 RepID=A0A518JVS6_9BACT|nr:Hsp20/alpha crystallin family protein [Rosistilla carotiformis]QDV69642.1 18 kDa heat shock protein [Rosistilla carotiformis]